MTKEELQKAFGISHAWVKADEPCGRRKASAYFPWFSDCLAPEFDTYQTIPALMRKKAEGSMP